MDRAIPELSRRALLVSLGLVGASACAVRGGSQAAADRPGAQPTGAPAADASGAVLDDDALLVRQLERATFGLTPALLAHVRSTGFDAWLTTQLEPSMLADPLPLGPDHADLMTAIDDSIPPPPPRGASMDERGEFRRATVAGVGARVLVRAAFAPDQLRQRVVDFFADRLHVSSVDAASLIGLDAYDRMLRTHALGRFEDLLVGSATSVSMLGFLDNATSRADRGRVPNENFARELLELHTVGVEGGYDESDVVEVAHVFSGWTIDRNTGSFAFRPTWHDLGPLASGGDVLGWRPDGPGEEAGRSLLVHLAHHPATAQRLSFDLARRLVSEDLSPDHPLVTDGARIYLDEDTAIAPVVRHLLTADEFAESATLMARRPIDLLATTLRRSDLDPTASRPAALGATLVGLSTVLGQLPYGWPSPDGYPAASAAWTDAGALISRWNAVTTLAGEPSGLTWSALGDDTAAQVLALCGPDIQLY